MCQYFHNGYHVISEDLLILYHFSYGFKLQEFK